MTLKCQRRGRFVGVEPKIRINQRRSIPDSQRAKTVHGLLEGRRCIRNFGKEPQSGDGPECDDLEFLPEIPDRGALARGGDAFNFIAIRNAIERWLGRPRDPENIAVIINADDILFPLATS